MIRIDADSYQIVGQKYGLPSEKCGMSENATYGFILKDKDVYMI